MNHAEISKFFHRQRNSCSISKLDFQTLLFNRIENLSYFRKSPADWNKYTNYFNEL